MRKFDIATLDRIIDEVIAPEAIIVDRDAVYPRKSLDALGKAGLLGLVSDSEVGGMGEPMRTAATVVERVGRACASTAMVLCMHYVATKIIELGHGPRAVREAIAAGRHITTVAVSEAGSRSHFWAPLGTAKAEGDFVRLDAHKTFVTSAGEADTYTWTSLPLAAEGPSTLWLVPRDTRGLTIPKPFDGLGLRGNASSSINAEGALVPRSAMLGTDGNANEILMPTTTWFVVLASACYLGVMEAATAKTIDHVGKAQLVHLGQSLADLPTIRAYIARMRIKTDMVRTFLEDTITAIETNRADASLRALQIKAAAGETASEVADLAMRVCGGVAYRKDGGVERHFRDARAATVMAQTTDVLYDMVGKAVCGMPLF